MAKDKNHVYSIDLDIKSTAASKQALKELQTAYEASNKDMDSLNASYAELAKQTKDITDLDKQYNKIIKTRLDDKDKEIDKLKAEKVAITANMKLTQTQKEEMIALVDENIKRFETDKKYIKAKEKEAKLLAKMNKMFHTNFNENSKSFKLAKNAVVLQEKLNNLIGKESKLRKAANKMASVGARVGKAGLKAGAKVAGGALALGAGLAGAAVGAANDIADKERALGSLKSGIDPSVADSVYIKTGADYQSIVAAINNLSDVTKDNAALVQGAVLEIQNPGVGKLLLSSSNLNTDNISKLNAAVSQIKKQTGIQDMSAALEAVTKSRSVTNGNVSQTDYIQAFAALQQRGFDGDQINRIVQSVASKKGDFIENLNNADLSKFTNDKQMKIRLANMPMGLERLDLEKGQETSSAQSVAEKLRQFELRKNELLIKFLPIVEQMLVSLDKALDTDTVAKVANGLVKLFTAVLPLLEPVLKLLEPLLEPLTKAIDWLVELSTNMIEVVFVPLVNKIKDAIKSALSWWDDENDDEKDTGVSGGARAQGGIITAPSLVGEAGPELVLPLDYSRAGRASQIIQNFNTNQSFNMSANQQTPLAFSQAVGNNRFVTRVNGL